MKLGLGCLSRGLGAGLWFALALGCGTTAQAANYNWAKTSGGTYNWNANASWSPNTGFPNAAGDYANLQVEIAAAQTINLNQAITIGRLSIGDTSWGPGYVSYIVQAGTGGSLVFQASSGNAQIDKSAPGTDQRANDTISAPVVLMSDLDVMVNVNHQNGSITLSGGITAGTAGTRTITNSGTGGPAGLIISGTAASDGAGLLKIVQNGASPLNLNVANTFSGGLEVKNGTATANATGALGASSNTVTVTGGTLTSAGNLAGAYKNGGTSLPITLNGGTVRLPGDGNTDVGGNLTYISGTVGLNRGANGAARTKTMGTLSIGTATLTPTQTDYSGTPTLAFGATTLTGGAATLDTGNVNINLGAVGGTGSLVKKGANTLTLTAAGTFSGGLTVSNGTVSANVSGALGASSNTVTVTGGTLTSAANVAGAYKNGTTSLPITLNGGTVRLPGDGNTDVGGNLTYISGAVLLNRVNNGGASTKTMGTLSIGTATLTPTRSDYTAAPTLVFGPTTLTGNATLDAANVNITLGAVGGSGSLVKTGADTLTLSSAGTFSGTTRVDGGTLALGNNLSLQNSALDTSGAGVVNASGRTTPTFGGLTGSKNLASVITTGYGSITALTLNPGTGQTNTYSGVIANGSGNMTLTKSGAGTQLFNGTNTYTGVTTVTAGGIGGSGKLAGNLALNAGTRFDAVIGNTLTVGNLAIGANCTLNLTGKGSGTIITYTGSQPTQFANVTPSYKIDYTTPGAIKAVFVPPGTVILLR